MNRYRHEIKMSINPFDKHVLSNRLSKMLYKDGHTGNNGYYSVRSLYFDDQNDSALKEKLLGMKYREKFRIRVYDNSTSVIRLEKKVKNDSLGYKESAMLTLDECNELLNDNYRFLFDRTEAVCKQLYARMRTGMFRPKTIVEYNREAYIWEPGRIRITIDSNIRTGIYCTDFLSFDMPMADVIDNGTSILEIKYDTFLPSHISNIIQLDSRQKNSVSKYVLCRRFG